MKERPIIFTNDHVEAILRGSKTQTRRVVKVGKDGFFLGSGGIAFNMIGIGSNICKPMLESLVQECPYGYPGEKIWVREKFFAENGVEKPAIYMPKTKSRATLLIKNVRVERLNSITESDCIAEGALPNATHGAREKYRRIWDSINNGENSWLHNPWVWVIEFGLENPN